MLVDNFIKLKGRRNSAGLFFVSGSFGMVDGYADYTRTEVNGKTVYKYSNDSIVLRAEFKEEYGVMVRRDTLENITDSEIEINSLTSRFVLDGNAYDVYTQYNGWQHESYGGWQSLNTQVSVSSQGIRTCDGATPMMALNNLYTNKNTVFHLLPNAQWQMTARKTASNEKEIVVVETGFVDRALRLKVAPGEIIELPTVIFFNAESKIDFDAYKLHTWFLSSYPRKKLPVMYNSWMYCFDRLNVDDLLEQVDCAAELGVEAFMIDAGWFGNGEAWSRCVGDWEENTLSGPKGRLMEISHKVREKGMIFGLWFEPERAAPTSKSVKEHPEYYIYNALLDFSNPEATDYVLEKITAQIEKYNIGWLKFDFNETISEDPSGSGFYRYLQGQKRFINTLRERFPEIIITNCASGGYRMELMQGTFSDTFWFSDNMGSYMGIDIIKDTLKRMPSALMERWNVQKYSEGFICHGEKEKVGVMFTCNNGTWDSILNVDDSFTENFINCGPIGFSCDIANFPESYKEKWKKHIISFKENRDFYANATGRILVDSPNIIVIQYADSDLNRCVIQIFTKTVYARDLIIYPAVDAEKEYVYENKKHLGKSLMTDGIYIDNLKNNSCKTIEIKKAES